MDADTSGAAINRKNKAGIRETTARRMKGIKVEGAIEMKERQEGMERKPLVKLACRMI